MSVEGTGQEVFRVQRNTAEGLQTIEGYLLQYLAELFSKVSAGGYYNPRGACYFYTLDPLESDD